MRDLAYRQQKIQEKRKQTTRRQFVREVTSRYGVLFYRRGNLVSLYPDSKKLGQIMPVLEFDDYMNRLLENQDNGSNTQSFFDQFATLMRSSPMGSRIVVGTNPNAEFADSILSAKNVYLSFTVVYECENIGYSLHVKDGCKDIRNSMMAWDHSSIVYASVGVIKSFMVFYSRYIYNSSFIWFSDNLVGCNECLFCSHLENQQYCIHNTPYTKEAYFIEKKRILSDKANYDSLFYPKHCGGDTIASSYCENCSFVIQGEHVTNVFFGYNVKNSRNCLLFGGPHGDEHIYDAAIGGSPFAQHIYGSINVGNSEHIYLSPTINGCSHIFYSYYLINSHYCLGCIGLKNKSYCIFNQQYSKEERYEKVNEIFSQMDKDGTLGEFFPPSMNPFYFNDTAAYLIDPTFTKEEVTAMGYLWRDEPIKVDIPTGVQTVAVEDLGNYEGWILNGAFSPLTHFDVETFQRGNVEAKRYIDPAILKKVIIDEHGNVYRIVKMEYDFLMKHGLPLPRKHWLERMKENFQIN